MKKSRRGISKRARFEVFKRDGFTCQYCGAHPPDVILHVDHIMAVSRGGTDDSENLVTACQACNLGKSDKPLTSIPRGLEEVAQEEAERVAQIEAHANMIRQAREKFEDAIWEIAEVLHPGASDGWARDKFNGVKTFVKRLGHAATLEAAYISEDAKPRGNARFRYFCGVCWNRIREKQAS